MRIGLVVPGFSASEADWCIPALRDYVRGLAPIDVVVFALRYPCKSGRYGAFAARVISLGGGSRQGPGSAGLWARTVAALAAEHRRARFDVLHAFWAGETGALASIAGRLLGVPAVVSLAGGELAELRDVGYGGQLTRAERAKTRLALRLAARVTAGSRFLQSLAVRRLGVREVVRAPLGVDTELFAPKPPCSSSGPPRVVQAASLVPVKDQTTLLRAAALLRDRGVSFRVEIAGAGPLEDALRAQIGRLRLDGHLFLRGEVPHDELRGFYSGAAAYVQSSLYEAQGVSLLEAAACGVPAVGTRVGVLPELEQGAAVGCGPGDPDELARAIAEVLGDQERRQAMSRAARAAVESQYSLERCVGGFRAIYEALR